jgi:hypothetical protein
MYGENNIKFVIARQAKEVYQYKNIKEKLHRTNAAIWYNKLCRQLQLTPKYIAIKVKVYICRNKTLYSKMYGENNIKIGAVVSNLYWITEVI